MTSDQVERIRIAEHRFCEAIDLKVNPETYDGYSCVSCIIGQLVIADELLIRHNDQFISPKAPTFFEWMEARDIDNGDIINMDIEQLDYQRRRYCAEWYANSQDICESVANTYGVDYDKVRAVYNGVMKNVDVGTDLEEAKKEVVAAYFDCDFL